MKQTVKVSSKRQLTIPSLIYREMKLHDGASLVMDAGPGYATITNPMHTFYELAGSLTTPDTYRHLPIEEIVQKGIERYISEKYSKKRSQ